MRKKSINNENITFANEVANVVKSVEPDSDVYLFGSRARGDNSNESDFDFFVLLNGEFNYNRKENLLSRLYDYQLKNMIFFDVIIKSKKDILDNAIFSHTPLYQNIKQDMIEL